MVLVLPRALIKFSLYFKEVVDVIYFLALVNTSLLVRDHVHGLNSAFSAFLLGEGVPGGLLVLVYLFLHLFQRFLLVHGEFDPIEVRLFLDETRLSHKDVFYR